MGEESRGKLQRVGKPRESENLTISLGQEKAFDMVDRGFKQGGKGQDSIIGRP